MRKCARKGCDCEFEPVKGIQKYCSRDCYLRVNTEKKRREPRAVVCSECGTEFNTTSANQKRCSRECTAIARQRYHRERDTPGLFDQPLEFKTVSFKRLPDGFTVLIVGDLHIPFQDAATLQCVESFWNKLAPDLEVYNGDVMDCYQLSVFSANPSRQFSLQDEFDTTAAWLRKRVKENPNGRRIFLEGNHEDRLRRWMWKLGPAVSSLRSNTIEEQLGLREMEFEHLTYRSLVRILGCEIQHGYRASRSAAMPQNVAQLMARATNSSGVCGHTHRINEVHWTDTRGSHSYRESGCLCRMDLEYAPFPNWQHAFSFGVVHKNKLHVQTVPIFPEGMRCEGAFYPRNG